MVWDIALFDAVVSVGAIAWFGADLRMRSASVGPVGIHRAMPAFGISKLTVATASSCKRKDAVFKIEVINEPLL
ncbi:MAG: hypothetical protein RIS60_2273, partial [Pseudomonadota bacterium]